MGCRIAWLRKGRPIPSCLAISGMDFKRLFMNFTSLYKSYDDDLRDVEKALADLFTSSASLIPAIGLHIMRGGGKRIRPLFLLITASMLGYTGRSHIVLASILEAIHTASLLHDDVVDAAPVRRGQPTANSLWGNQVVVLVGDFLYANALREAVYQKNQMIMEHLSTATTRMTEGELMQLSKTGDPHVTEDDYLRIIAGKTGALFSAACGIGAILAGGDEQHINAVSDFGLKVGMVFQMTDDILDYGAEQELFGKKLGKDLEEGKITLPLILLRDLADTEERRELVEILTSDITDAKKNLLRIHALFEKYEILQKSMERAAAFTREANLCLSVFDNSHDTEELKILAEYALQRGK